MLAFFRHLMVFLLGALVGAVAILFFLPTFSATFSNVPSGAVGAVVAPTKPAEPVAKVEEPAKPAEPVAKVEEPAKPAEPVAKVEEPAKPAEPVAKVEEPAKPAEPAKPMTEEPAKSTDAVAKVEPKPKTDANQKLDYTALNARPIFWPPSVLVTTATSTSLMEKGKKVADIPLAEGDVLQVSKVLGDGTLEVRAQGLKFEIDQKLTDFEAGVRRKITELADKGSTIPAPYKTDRPYVPPIAPLPTAPVPVEKPTPVVTEKPTPTTTKPTTRPKDTLDDKMNSLFGRKATPEEVADAKKKPAK
ncbi:MAG: hypothetical protein RL636_826 [Verrucomicrobiota bacterium]|jgi:hypothetical protein